MSTSSQAAIPPVHLAVIAAAIHSVLGAGRRVVAVSPVLDWAREGRRDIFLSHRVR